MLVQFGNIKLNLEKLNLVVLGISTLFPHWTVCSLITYTNVVFTLNLP